MTYHLLVNKRKKFFINQLQKGGFYARKIKFNTFKKF